MDNSRFKEFKEHETVITYYMLNYTNITPREVAVSAFERIIDLYIENNGDKETMEKYKGYLEELTDDSKYLERIEAKYEEDSNRFRGDMEVIAVMHDNLISVCKKLHKEEKATYYEGRKQTFIDNILGEANN